MAIVMGWLFLAFIVGLFALACMPQAFWVRFESIVAQYYYAWQERKRRRRLSVFKLIRGGKYRNW